MLDHKQYVQDAIRTESRVEYVAVNHGIFAGAISATVAASETLDVLKKTMFYGKELDGSVLLSHALDLQVAASTIIVSLRKGMPPDALPVDPRVLHAVIGKCTEAGELLAAVDNSMGSEEGLDIVNVKEELGDDMWYGAILCDALGLDLEEICNINIAKLMARYPDKFTQEEAINRDLDGERKVLEGAE